MALRPEGAVLFSRAAHLKENALDTVWLSELLAFDGTLWIIINAGKIESKRGNWMGSWRQVGTAHAERLAYVKAF